MKTSSSKVVKTETTVEVSFEDILEFIYSKYPELKKSQFSGGFAQICSGREFDCDSTLELNFEETTYE